MGLFRWKCPQCGKGSRALLPPGQVPLGVPPCLDCDLLMEPDHGGSTSVMETLDNGVMARKLERYRDIEELRHSHAELTKPKDDTIV